MSNPTGDALVSIGIEDTQKLSDEKIRRALSHQDQAPEFLPFRYSDVGRFVLAVAAVLVVALVI